MKLNLLLATSLITGAAFGQFTQANEPAVGTSVTMYVLDSNAVNYATTTGAGVTWDYSTTPGVYGETKSVSVIAPSNTYFPSSTKAIQIPGFITTYFSSTASARESQGFTFEDPSAGSIDVALTSNTELLMNYPFNLNSEVVNDAFAGNAHTSMVPMPIPTTGTVSTKFDGTGTLKLSSSVTLNNVSRYKIVENATANAGILTVTINRTQYEYYDLANSSLPVLVHAELTVDMGGPATQHLVMSSVSPDEFLNVSKNNKAEFGLYPNPANESVVVSGLSGNELISLIDMSGRTVFSTQSTGATQTLNVADLQAGVYNVVVITDGSKSVKKLTIN